MVRHFRGLSKMQNLEVEHVLASSGDKKISIVTIEGHSFVRVRKAHEAIILSKEEYEDFADTIDEAKWALNEIRK
jgi:hypothetical protein